MKALLVSHSGQRCGIFQYGVNLLRVLESSDLVKWHYAECDNAEAFNDAMTSIEPDVVLFNYQASTLPWLSSAVLEDIEVPSVGIYHESNQALVDREDGSRFDYWLCPDPTIVPRNPRILTVPRFLPECPVEHFDEPSPITIGSFGFATRTKGFERLCKLVNEQFDEAVIRLNMPEHDKPWIMDISQAEMVESCRAEIRKSQIRLDITHDFFDETALLNFLARNSINVFLYQDPNAKGLSSCIDYALAARRPIAVTRSPMFQHLAHINPSIFVEDAPLKSIAQNGTAALDDLRERFSTNNASRAWNEAIVSIADRRKKASMVPDRRGFNKILDDRSRTAYRHALDEIARLSPEMLSRKIERANIQQAFAFDTALRALEGLSNPRILAAGSFEDTAVDALNKLGYVIEEVDPNINGMTLLDFYVRAAEKLGTFDVVLSVSVLEHVGDDVQFLKIATEFLKPGGLAILTVDFNNEWQPGRDKPIVDHRLYTTEYIEHVLMPAVGNCVLIDVPSWAEGIEDFEYEGCRYGFAGLVLKKLEADHVRHAAVPPAWADLLAGAHAASSPNDLMTSDVAVEPTTGLHAEEVKSPTAFFSIVRNIFRTG